MSEKTNNNSKNFEIPEDLFSDQNVSKCDMVKEAMPAYGEQSKTEVEIEYEEPAFGEPWKKGPYTIEDYFALPEELRVELIDGTFYYMEAPTTIHQSIGGFIYKILLDHVLVHGGACMPFIAPVDVQLDKDDKTMVQPDVLIVCDRSKHQKGRVFGAPDFLVEVLSPSTRRKDSQYKLYKYSNAGVREYWVVDPKKKRIIAYDLEHGEFPTIYGEKDTVPVKIWNGECKVDFSWIFSYISFLYD